MTAILPLKQQHSYRQRERAQSLDRVQGDAKVIIFPGIRYERLGDDHSFQRASSNGKGPDKDAL